jgi:predicted metal-dependent enzyme (double-stranded beta helix superfamily)
MKRILERLEVINELDLKSMSYEDAFEKVFSILSDIDFASVDVSQSLPDSPSNEDYSRYVVQMKPFECVILYWPPGRASAIHLHQGFWGYVAVVRGRLVNREFTMDNRRIKEYRISEGLPGGILKEPDGVIHDLRNPDKQNGAVTIHFLLSAFGIL